MSEINEKDITDDSLYENASCEQSFERLYAIVKKLRSPSGCPWDREQTPVSMRQPLIEECYEAVDAINQNDANHVCEELGDVFLNSVLISNIYEEKKDFTLAQVLNGVCSKIVRRHPHVWPPKNNDGAECIKSAGDIKTGDQVVSQWEKIKQQMEGRKQKCCLDEVSYGLPPLLRSYKIQKKAAKKGFDWDNTEDVWKKIYEELDELKEAQNSGVQDDIEAELGDALFSIVNLARKLKVDPEVALSRTNKKFRDRYAFVEEKMDEKGIEMKQENLSVMDEFWNQAKKEGL